MLSRENQGIYKVTSPSGKVYIGQSVDIAKRFNDYRYAQCKNQTRLYHSFNKYGVENHIFDIFDILELCMEDLLNEKERYYQDLYNAVGVNGLNCKLTGTNDKSGRVSEKTRKRMVLAGLNQSAETRKKNSEANLGRKHTKESIQKMIKNHANSKKTICIAGSKVFNSITEAANFIGKNSETLAAALNGRFRNKTSVRYYNNDSN